MDLFIGNATRQVYDFCYKVPENQKLFSQKIHPGTFQKIAISHLTKPDIDYIIAQHAKYGLIAEDEIDRAKGFFGICYSVDKPITRTRLLYLMDHNLGKLVERGHDIRATNAIAQNNMVNNALVESGMSERVQSLDMTIQQENADPGNDVPQMSDGIFVTTEHDAPPQHRGRGRPRKVA